MEDSNIMRFKDEEGNLVEMEAVARIFLEDQEYLILAPPDSEEEEFVFRIDRTDEGGEEYNVLDSDEEFLKVKKEYSRLLYEGENSDE